MSGLATPPYGGVRSSAYSGRNKLRVSGLSSHVGQSLCGVQRALLGCPQSAARARDSSGAGECGAGATALRVPSGSL
jgi:hypothetical protein